MKNSEESTSVLDTIADNTDFNKDVEVFDIEIFNCEKCNEFFSDDESLQKHVLTIHKVHRRYRCRLCNKIFTEKHFLRKHMHRAHEKQTLGKVSNKI